MTWTDDRLAALPVKGGFRLLGLEMTRLETFCDAAFAFAVTLLVISGGGIPTSYEALVEALLDVPAFLCSFAAIGSIWIAHRRWSRLYGLEDGWTTLISLAMVFVMLIYVYPLRMVASAFMAFVSGGRLPTGFTLTRAGDLTGLFVIYGMGFAVQMVMLALLSLRALKAAGPLRLDAVERLHHHLRHRQPQRAGAHRPGLGPVGGAVARRTGRVGRIRLHDPAVHHAGAGDPARPGGRAPAGILDRISTLVHTLIDYRTKRDSGGD